MSVYYVSVGNTISSAAVHNAIKIDGAANPVFYGFTTSPNIFNNQSNVAGTQTIPASDITLTASTLAAANINQGTSNNIVYAVQIEHATVPVAKSVDHVARSIIIRANDIATFSSYVITKTPTIVRVCLCTNAESAFDALHT